MLSPIRPELNEFQRLSKLKNDTISEYSLALNLLKNNINEKEIKQAELIQDLNKANSEKKLFSLKASRLQTKVQEADKERRELSKKIIEQEKLISESKVEQDSIKSRYHSQLKAHKILEDKTNYLIKENEKKACLLQGAIDKTNRYALEMDQTKEKIESIKQEKLSQEEQLQRVKKEMYDKQQILADKEQQIRKVDSRNQQLEELIGETKNKLNQNIIDNDILRSKIIEEKLLLEKSSGKEKQKLLKQIEEGEKQLASVKKEKLKLEKVFKDQEYLLLICF